MAERISKSWFLGILFSTCQVWSNLVFQQIHTTSCAIISEFSPLTHALFSNFFYLKTILVNPSFPHKPPQSRYRLSAIYNDDDGNDDDDDGYDDHKDDDDDDDPFPGYPGH